MSKMDHETLTDDILGAMQHMLEVMAAMQRMVQALQAARAEAAKPEAKVVPSELEGGLDL